MEHLPSLEYALPLVATAHPDGASAAIALYDAVQRALRSAGQPTVPLGAFNRLIRAAGFPRRSMRSPGRQSFYFEGLNLLDDASGAV
ncbi:hypothetical protein ACWEWX_07870 [Streptomyces asiaticus]